MANDWNYKINPAKNDSPGLGPDVRPCAIQPNSGNLVHNNKNIPPDVDVKSKLVIMSSALTSDWTF